MTTRIDGEHITSAREMVENERQRLLGFPLRLEFKTWLAGREWPLEWMKNRFGPTLIEKDGLTYPNGEVFDGADCSVCGHCPDADECIIHFEFSFCGEYGCGMNVCRGCLERLLENINTKEASQ